MQSMYMGNRTVKEVLPIFFYTSTSIIFQLYNFSYIFVNILNKVYFS